MSSTNLRAATKAGVGEPGDRNVTSGVVFLLCATVRGGHGIEGQRAANTRSTRTNSVDQKGTLSRSVRAGVEKRATAGADRNCVIAAEAVRVVRVAKTDM